MPPKINGNTISDLVRHELDNLMDHHKKEMIELSEKLEDQLDKAHEQLLGALARITCLENELTKVQHSPKEHFSSKKSSKICKHWLRNNCTWKQKCRFSHEGSLFSFSGSAKSASQLSLNSSFQAKQMKEIMKTENTDTSINTDIININGDEKNDKKVELNNVQELLIPKHPERQKSETSDPGDRPCLSAPPAVPTIGHRVHKRSVTSGGNPKKIKTAPPPESPQKELMWQKKVLDKVEALEVRYSEKYQPRMDEEGIIHSSSVLVPRIDFQKVKPHLQRNLPKPEAFPVHGCSPDSNFYEDAHILHEGRYEKAKFDLASPFGTKAGFETNLGIVSIPDTPLHGYIYAGGYGNSTRWQLFAEAVYI